MRIKIILSQFFWKLRTCISPYTALNDLDKKIEKYLPKGGVFLEAGANDGIRQSNTYFLERKYNWNGILVEPIPPLASQCRKNRSSHVFNFALVGPENSGKLIDIVDVDLMSIALENNNQSNLENHIETAERVLSLRRKTYKVEGRTISEVINSSPFDYVDFLSLDVEGYEVEVLKGLDFSLHSPKLILVETKKLDEVLIILNFKYKLLEQLSHHDFLLELAG